MYNLLMPRRNNIQLNVNQQKAVKHGEGPLLVVAGAGTGKTRVITERIRYLIEQKKTGPQEILALTFTEKASQEMLDRTGDAMPLGYEEPWIYTFHSFADRVLKTEGLEIGLDTGYKILSTPDQWLLFRKNLFSFNLDYYRPLGNPTKFISAILKFISRLQDENISPQDFQDYVNKVDDRDEKKKLQELADVYQKYQDLKISGSRLDFGDLITWTLKLFAQRPNILKKYRKQFKHILIDEFQDTNYSQYELIRLLCPHNMKSRSLMVVGDDSQSIYKFRGAAISNILEFQKDYPQAKMITLLKNYRSYQEILDPAYKLIKNNNPDTLESKLGISKELISEKEGPAVKPQVFRTETWEEEVDLVILKILEILAKEPQYTFKDFAILARANNHLDPFILALRKYGLPYQLIGNRGLYDREEIRDIIAFLKILPDTTDSVSLYRVLNIDVLDISHDEISKMLSSARARKTTLWELIKESEDKKVVSLCNTISKYQGEITKTTPVEIVYNLVNSIGYLNPLLKEENIENQLTIKNLDLFLNKVKQFEIEYRNENKEIPTIVDFIDYIELMMEAGDNPAQAEFEDVETVNLLTVHSSKGLEFPVVFMVNLVAGRFPTRDRKEQIPVPDELIKETLPIGDAHLQEERRLFYVGMTRAKKHLYLTLSKNYGGKRDTVPSGFIKETGIKIEEADLEGIKKDSSQTGLFGIQSGFREPRLQKIGNFVPEYLSYTQVSTYQTCPLKYKFSFVLSIPTPPSHTLSFGSTIHDTLRDFHSHLIMGGRITLESLLEIYQKNWEPLGYLNEEHRKERYRKGEEILKRYYKENINSPVKPLAVEKGFNIRIDGMRFYGRIDRIDPLKTGGVEIIDYKTGNTKDQKEVDKDAQVAFYALGVKEALKLKPEKLSFYFVETGEKISTTRTEKQLEEKKKEVAEVLKNIKSGNFKANPGRHCKWCDYQNICPFAYKG
jgi:DNA helicase II / ATP-dependent DNA helicase PcrA